MTILIYDVGSVQLFIISISKNCFSQYLASIFFHKQFEVILLSS